MREWFRKQHFVSSSTVTGIHLSDFPWSMHCQISSHMAVVGEHIWPSIERIMFKQVKPHICGRWNVTSESFPVLLWMWRIITIDVCIVPISSNAECVKEQDSEIPHSYHDCLLGMPASTCILQNLYMVDCL